MPPDLDEARRRRTGEIVERLLLRAPGARRCPGDGPGDIEVPALDAAGVAGLAASLGLGVVQRRALAGAGTLHVLAAPGLCAVRVLATTGSPLSATPGLLVVLMGPDGCGKSTLVRRMVEAWRPVLGTAEAFHLRPRLGPQTDRTLTVADDPHGQRPRGVVMSLAKLGFLLGDYRIGHWASVLPILRAGGLALFDRYAFDLVADPARFRYGGPMGVARLLTRLVPQPDLILLLDAPAETLRRRKPELPVETIEGLRHSYRATLGDRAVILDATRAPEQLGLDADAVLIDHLHRRNRATVVGDGA